MLIKVLKYLLVVAIVIYLFLRFARRGAAGRASPAAASPATGEDMVACAACGMYFPRAEAIVRDGRSYCCAAHGEQGARR